MCVCVCVSARACSGMCVAVSGCARAVMKMRSGKVVPLCSINQGGKENGCERQSPETAPREAERGRWEGEKFCGEWRSGPRRSPSPRFPPRRVPSLELRRRDSGEIAPLIPVSSPLPRLPALFPRSPPTHPHLNGPHRRALCVDGEAPCTQPLQERIRAPEHTPVALVIAHLLLAQKRRGSRARGGGSGGRPAGIGIPRPAAGCSPLSAPKDSGPAFLLHAVRFPGLADTHYRDPPAPPALRFPPAAGERGAPGRCFPARCPVTPNPESPGLRLSWAGTEAQVPGDLPLRERGTSVEQPGMGRGGGRGFSSFFL